MATKSRTPVNLLPFQQTFIYSNSTIETLEEDMNDIQS